MVKGIPCFEYSEIGPKGQNQIDFQFVSGNGEIVSSCRVSLGDTDPLSGEKITDVTFFEEYRRLHNRQVHFNKKAIRVPLTKREKAARAQLREQLSAGFEREYGYAPDPGTLKWLVSEKWPRTYRMELDSFVDEYGLPLVDYFTEFTDSAAEENIHAVEADPDHFLEAFAASLDENEREMFRLLQLKAEGVQMCGMINSLAEKWGVPQYQVSRMKNRIGRKLLKWMKEAD